MRLEGVLPGFALAVVVLCSSLSAGAQDQGGSLQGTITDGEGRFIPAAVVTVSGPDLQGTQTGVTDLSGQYVVPFLPAGRGYQVQVEADGFGKVVRKGIAVPLGTTVNLPFTLAPGTTVITVTAAAPTVDVKSTATGLSLSDTLINAIPLPRDAAGLAFLAPTVVGGGASTPRDPSIGGSTGAENNYIINGVDVTDTGYGTNGAVLNFDFIQDYQVLTGGLPPEYGASMGGVINAITRSGGNEFHGSLFAYAWSDGTQARSVTYPWAPVVQGNDGFTRYDVGGSLGGYFVKDKLWFYLAYDYNSYEEYTAVPAGAEYGDQYLYLNGRPAQSVYAGHRITDTDTTNPMAAFKLTWNVNMNQRLALSLFGNDNRTHAYGNLATLTPVSAPYSTHERPYNISLQWNSIWTPKFFSEVNVSYRHRTREWTINPAAAENWTYAYQFSSNPYGGFRAYPKDQTLPPVGWGKVPLRIDLGGNYQPSYGAGATSAIPRDESGQFRAKFTHLVGAHEISYGLQWARSKYEPTWLALTGPRDFVSPATGQTAVGGLFVQWAPVQSLGLPPGPGGEQYVYAAMDLFTPSNRPSTQRSGVGWINDTWAVTRYVTLKLGLRYDEQKLTGDLTGVSIRLADNWAPRLGFTWDVTHDGKSKLYGFAGRYFERVPADIAARSLNHEVSGLEYFYDPGLTLWTGTSYIFGTAHYIQGQAIPPAGQMTPAQAAAFGRKLKAPYTDEFILGYTYQWKSDLTVGARVLYRKLGRTIEDLSYDGGETYVIANPDQWTDVPAPSQLYPGTYGRFPEPKRFYEAIALTLDKRFSRNWQFGASYVYSVLKGNYEGAGNNDTGQLDPNFSSTYDFPDFLVNGYGLLPLDRTHVVKVYGSYQFENIPLQLSGNFQLASGTPISRQIAPWYPGVSFATPRGSYGRTPYTWSLDLGAEYTFDLPLHSRLGLRVDVFNVFNNQVETAVYQTWQVKASPEEPITMNNSQFNRPYQHQAPRLVRFALRWTF